MRWRLDRLAWQMTTARLTRQSGGDIRQAGGCWENAGTSTVGTRRVVCPGLLSGRTSVTHPSSYRRVVGLGLQNCAHSSCQLFAGASLCAAGLEKRQRGGERPATRVGALAMGRCTYESRPMPGVEAIVNPSALCCVVFRSLVSPASHSPCVPGWCLELLPQRLGTSYGDLLGGAGSVALALGWRQR